MIKNYLKIAWRNLLRNKGYTLINIGGLCLGMTIVLLIGLWVQDELTFDKNHENYKDISQVLVRKSRNGKKVVRYSLPYPLGSELRLKHAEDFEHIVMSSFHGDNILASEDKVFTRNGGFMEPGVLSMLSLNMIHGDWECLNDPYAVVLSESTSESFFGKANPLGKTIKIGNKIDVLVTGVYKDLPHNSTFKNLEFILPWDLYAIAFSWVKYARDNNVWDNNSYQVFVQTAKGKSLAAVTNNIEKTVFNNLSEDDRPDNPKLLLNPMEDWHLRSGWRDGFKSGGFIQYVWLFGIIGLFVMLLACINFMNLSTAQSEKRAKEVGIRKTIGSSKKQLINQFLVESFLMVSLAFLFAVLIVFLVIPSFNLLADKEIVFPFNNGQFWFISFLFIVITSLLAGSYPALYLSSFRPVSVLKGAFKTGKSTTTFRRVLVVMQFTVSVILIIGTVVVHKQIHYVKSRPMGYDMNGVIMIGKNTEDYEGKYNIMRSELLNSGAVVEMAESSSPLTDVWSTTGGFEWEGKSAGFITNLATISISHDYGKTIGWDLVEGRDFSRDFATDSTAFVLNESAVKYMGLKDPVGKIIRWNNQEHEVIGVVKDILATSPFEPIMQTVYLIKYSNTNWIELKLNPNQSVSSALSTVKNVMAKHAPNVPFDYQFVDDTFAKKFEAIERIGKLSTIFSMLAIFISCLGLFGLASFIAEKRTKEIGIRKVIGASVFDIWELLSKDFIKLVVVAIIIATPLAYYGGINWLNNYTYRTDVSWWVFVIASLGAVGITLITVSFQALKTAFTNPIKSLRTE
ncbi:ABC transporter permease [uncultured Algibacter sp.]|uniref:ABC transporter permease n=1 Tax=uncultured Algibacter sp. TaxID=298659 RepID=UPI002627B0F0|nr:ABC transporter permease [uncultured Algibacter sp.]